MELLVPSTVQKGKGEEGQEKKGHLGEEGEGNGRRNLPIAYF